MRYRRFGQTELELSVFSLGTMRFSSQEVAEATVAAALAQGINHLETARGYGESERFVGQALGRTTPQRPYLTTKLSPLLDGPTLGQQLRESLSRLQVDSIDCVALHGINRPEHLATALAPEGALAGLEAMRDLGLVRHIGFSSHGSLELILQILETRRFAFANLHYYYFFQRHGAAIALAQALDMGIFIISPTDKGGQLYAPPKTLSEACAPFSPQSLNYRFLLSDPRITTLSLGAACPRGAGCRDRDRRCRW
ncbi:MAG: aldo/keto reductase, partial [Synechococcales cyanobacterium RU_4_20]|nr:aldo/keto reductase [Synechococcales cyanobacterium RU_4_20]